MKNLLRVALPIGLVLFALISSQGQSTGVAGGSQRKFEHHAEIVSVYDKTKNQTTVILDWYRVYAGLLDPKRVNREVYVLDAVDNRVDIQAAFVYPGRVLSSTPDVVEFGIKVGNSGGPLFTVKEPPELAAVVDGETISLGKALPVKLRTWVTAQSSRQVSFAQLSARFTYQGLLRIIMARKVGLKIGTFEFDLRRSNLEALRDLASRMEP